MAKKPCQSERSWFCHISWICGGQSNPDSGPYIWFHNTMHSGPFSLHNCVNNTTNPKHYYKCLRVKRQPDYLHPEKRIKRVVVCHDMNSRVSLSNVYINKHGHITWALQWELKDAVGIVSEERQKRLKRWQVNVYCNHFHTTGNVFMSLTWVATLIPLTKQFRFLIKDSLVLYWCKRSAV